MSVASELEVPRDKRRILYGAMFLVGALFVSTMILPVSESIAQLLAVLSFGVMSGLWIAHLVYSL